MLTQPITYFLNKDNLDEKFLVVTNDVVPGIRPYYLVSDFGNVYSANTNRLMTKTLSTDGYNVCTVRTIYNTGVTVYIHRIEMLTFKYEPGCEDLSIDHIDCNKTNNHISNLEWVTLGENTRRASANGLLLTGEDAPWTKVTDAMVHEICKMYVSGYGISEISRSIGCGLDSVFRVVHGIGRRNISSLYDIESRYRGYLTDEQIHIICSIYSQMKGIEYSKIKLFIAEILSIRIDRNIDSILRCLYRHDVYCYYGISSKYDY